MQRAPTELLIAHQKPDAQRKFLFRRKIMQTFTAISINERVKQRFSVTMARTKNNKPELANYELPIYKMANNKSEHARTHTYTPIQKKTVTLKLNDWTECNRREENLSHFYYFLLFCWYKLIFIYNYSLFVASMYRENGVDQAYTYTLIRLHRCKMIQWMLVRCVYDY